MKKIDLLHTTVLIVAILCGYSALQVLVSMLDASFYYSDFGLSRAGGYLFTILLQAGAYTTACIILVRNSKRIATYLLGNDRPEYEEFLQPDVDETAGAETTSTETAGEATGGAEIIETENPGDLEWRLDRQGILFALFIGLGLYKLIYYIPHLLNDVISRFKDEVGAGALNLNLGRPAGRDYLILDLLQITFGAILVYAAPTLTNYIENTIASRLHRESKTM